MFLKRFRKSKPSTDRYTDANQYVAAYHATGDLAILGELYEQHIDLVYAVCYNYLHDEEEAKDAVMHLFEQLVTDLRRHNVQQFQPWLHSVARNYCLMQLRSQKMHVMASLNDAGLSGEQLSDRFDPDEDLSTATVLVNDEAVDLEENLTHMEACLQTLPIEQRTCLNLFYLERKSYTDVASLTGYELKQVKSYLQNGRRNLKICMGKQHG